MQVFEANPKLWRPIPNGNNLYPKIINTDKLRKCLCKYDKECAMVYSRIGSPSMDAEVYSIIIDNQEYAAKVLPIVNDKSYDKIERELCFAKITSEAVRKGIVSHFLIYYGHYECNDTIYKEDSKFNIVSQKYALINSIISNMSKVEAKRKYYSLNRMSFEEIRDLYPNIQYDTSSKILFSQLLWGDLRTYLEEDRSEKEWNLIIDQILVCCKELEMLNIGHNDLHLGNILIKDIDTLESVIHDYGRSSNGYNKDDLEQAIDALTRINPPTKILNRLNMILQNY